MDQGKSTEQWYSKLFRVLNSAVCFSLAYIILTYAFWFATGFAGRMYKFDVFVYYYGVKFILNNHSWNKGNVTFIYFAGPLMCLFLGLVSLFFYKRLQYGKSLLSVFFLWSFVLGTGIFAAQGIVAALGTYQYESDYYHGLSVVYSWWHIPVFLVYVLIIPFAALLLYFSVNYARPFLLFAYSFSKVNKLSRRRKYFFETAVAPFALGAIITSMVTVTKHLPLHVNMPLHIVYMAVTGCSLMVALYSITYVDVLKKDIARLKNFQTPNMAFVILLGIAWLFVYMTFRGIYIA